ncbi:hypothetical protein AYI96_14350 [Shewanella sp. MSW]|nr:hypothetical protein AYI96_14350 [Shewanella sp. MSW]
MGLDARHGSQQMAIVLCKKHNTAGRPVIWAFTAKRHTAYFILPQGTQLANRQKLNCQAKESNHPDKE